MNKRRWGRVCFGVLMVGLVLASYRQLNPPARPGSVAFHEGEIERLRWLKDYVFEGRPQSRSDWLHPKTWRWWLLGSHDLEKTGKEMDRHQAALLRMGHYQRREIVLSNNIMAASWDRGVLTNLFVVKDYFYHELATDRPSSVVITTTRKNADRLEAIFRRWDVEEAAKAAQLPSASVP